MRFKKMESLKESEKRGLVFTFMNMGVVLCLPLTKLVPSSFSLEDPNNFKVTEQVCLKYIWLVALSIYPAPELKKSFPKKF